MHESSDLKVKPKTLAINIDYKYVDALAVRPTVLKLRFISIIDAKLTATTYSIPVIDAKLTASIYRIPLIDATLTATTYRIPGIIC